MALAGGKDESLNNVALAAILGDNVPLASRKDESVDDDNVVHAAGLGDNMALAGRQEVNMPFNNDMAPPADTTTPWLLMAALETTPSMPHRLVWSTPQSHPPPQ